MLATLDQWAFQFLMVLYGVLGVQELPKTPDPNWKVVEQWVELPDGLYRLTIENSDIADKCKNNSYAFVVFPQIYMGRQQIYSGDTQIYTNSMSYEWNLKTIFDRPVLSCDLISNSKKITFVTTSYLKYFSSLNSYPYLHQGYPFDQFFYGPLFLISAFICLSLCLVGEVLLKVINPKEKSGQLIGLGAFSFIVMFTHQSGIFYEINVQYIHTLILSSLVGLGSSFVYPKIKGSLSRNQKFISVCTILSLCVLSLLSKNFTQAAICVVVLFFIATILFMAIRGKNFTQTERVLYFFVFFIGLKDWYLSQAIRSGFLYLSILSILIVVIAILRIAKEMNENKMKIIETDSKLIVEKAILEKVSQVYESYREIIHDLKSPITAINFLLKSKEVQIPQLEAIGKRTSDILDRIEESGYRRVAGWYSINLCKHFIDEINIEKRVFGFSLVVQDNKDVAATEVFIDPIDFKIVISELIDNSIKAESTKAEIIFQILKNERVSLIYKDNGQGVRSEIKDNLAEKGFSIKGSGTGLNSVRHKLNRWGSEIIFHPNQIGFSCTISLKCNQVAG